MRIKLNISEKKYLLNEILKDKELLIISTNIKEINKAYFIDITNEDADYIRDLCCEMLDMHGFDKNYELTSEGKVLEDLIDLFYVNETKKS